MIISNDEIHVIKIIKSLEDSGLLLKGDDIIINYFMSNI